MRRKKNYYGLVLPGGSARGAYQVGVLKAIADFMPKDRCPFDVMTGTSVGAINTLLVASYAHAYREGVKRVENLWSGLHADKIYNTGFIVSFMTVLNWLMALIFMGLGRHNPIALLDNRPLVKLLEKELDFENLGKNIDDGLIRAVGISASSYAQGRAVTFFQGHQEIEEWERKRRDGKRTDLTVQHVMASASLPFIFCANRIEGEYFGDGSLRLNAPLSPAIHLGASRILVVGIRDKKPDSASEDKKSVQHPTLGSLAGHLLDIAFSDNLDSDIERLCRINKTLSYMNAKQREKTEMKYIDIMQVQPSKDIREIAGRYFHELPWTLRMLIRGVGGQDEDWRLASYFLFESGFAKELIELGYRDAMVQKNELIAFLDKERTGVA